jgi:hypothetical protein
VRSLTKPHVWLVVVGLAVASAPPPAAFGHELDIVGFNLESGGAKL